MLLKCSTSAAHVSLSLSCFRQSAVLFPCVCGAAVHIYRPACPIDWWRREESSFIALQGLFHMQRPSLSSCVFSEKSRASGGLTVSPGPFLRKTPFFNPPLPHFHDPRNARRGCSNSRWLKGGAPNTSFLSPPCLSSQVPPPLFSPSSFGSAVFIHTQASSLLYVWKDHAGWNRPSTPHIALVSVKKELSCSALKRWCLRERGREMWQHRLVSTW